VAAHAARGRRRRARGARLDRRPRGRNGRRLPPRPGRLRPHGVNRIYTQDGTLPGRFFTYATGDEAGTLRVDPSVQAGTLRTGTAAAGDNTIALAVGFLRGRPAPENGADGLYAALVTRVGADVRGAKRTEANAQVLLDSVDDRRGSTSAVSMDEEMTNLVRFQRGYQASARAMSAMDEMLDTLINRTGRVGL
jgi:flagellar hook-associated protein 1